MEKTEYGYFLISYASPQGPLTPLEAFFGGCLVAELPFSHNHQARLLAESISLPDGATPPVDN